MKKWYNEEYEFEIEVTAFCAATAPSVIAETARKSVTSTYAPTAVR